MGDRSGGSSLVVAIAASAIGAEPEPSTRDTMVADAVCTSLVDADFSRVVDAPTQITDAKLVRASGSIPAYCEVQGYVMPTVGFVLRLPPYNWNGKFLEQGCGGFCGSSYLARMSYVGPVLHGYAYLVFDGGHSEGVQSALWSYNNLQAQFDFGVRGPHVVALAGKAITQHYYGRAPKKAYFQGCSTAGQQALSEAQRFPWDFDGIVAGAPSPTFSGTMMYFLWAGRALAGIVSQADLRLVHDRAVAQCDMDDRIKDGIIGDPLHCHFDPAVLQCKAGQNSQCLTAAKVEAVKKVYSGPTTSTGEKLYTGGPLPGSELNWITNDMGDDAFVHGSAVVSPYQGEYFTYMGFMPAPGPGWKPNDFDFDRDYKRLRLAESLVGAADNPDLRKFKASGGKLIIYQGGQDQSDIPTDAIDYYETTERTMGGRAATQEFLRLFLIPGMNHCSGGPGAYAIDYLKYLEDWVERGLAPDKMIGAHIKGAEPTFARPLVFPIPPSIPVDYTRPFYPYPIRAEYKGIGDPHDAASFGPVGSQ